VTFPRSRLDGRYVFIHKEDKDWLVRKRGKQVNTSTMSRRGSPAQADHWRSSLPADGFTKAQSSTTTARPALPAAASGLAPGHHEALSRGVDSQSFFEKERLPAAPDGCAP